MADERDININFTDEVSLYNDNAHGRLFEIGLNERVIRFLVKYFSNEINILEISNADLLNEFYKDKLNALQWFPLGLSLEMTYSLYINLRNKGYSLESIFWFFAGDINKCIELYNSLKEANLVVDFKFDDEEFKAFISNGLQLCEKDISKTESFIRMFTTLEEKNKNLLRRLQ
jgi:hypothetical protein